MQLTDSMVFGAYGGKLIIKSTEVADHANFDITTGTAIIIDGNNMILQFAQDGNNYRFKYLYVPPTPGFWTDYESFNSADYNFIKEGLEYWLEQYDTDADGTEAKQKFLHSIYAENNTNLNAKSVYESYISFYQGFTYRDCRTNQSIEIDLDYITNPN